MPRLRTLSLLLVFAAVLSLVALGLPALARGGGPSSEIGERAMVLITVASLLLMSYLGYEKRWWARRLRAAAARGDLPALEEALRRRTPPDAADTWGQTALNLAVQKGQVEAARRLVEHGASPVRADMSGQTPLLRAVRAEDDRMVRTLILSGGRLRGVGRGISQALSVACAEGRTAVVEPLLEASAQPKERLEASLAAAAYHGHEEVVRTLLERRARRGTSAEASTSLLAAAQMGHAQVVRDLLAAGAAPDQATPEGATAIAYAVTHGHLEVLEALLEGGAAMEAPCLGPDIPLSLAAAQGNRNVVAWLLDRGADLHSADERALMTAVYHGRAELVDLLLERGADPGHVDADGDTPLALAEGQGYPEIAARLRHALRALPQRW
jgi:ankyrin repeat protein